jgi:predicted aspartyl protease
MRKLAPLNQTYQGKSYYSADHREGPHQLLVAVACYVGDLPDAILALLDTGSQWCILSSHVAEALGYETTEGEEIRLHTRYGVFPGRLERLLIRFHADEGQAIEAQATWFVSRDWPGPTVIGWKGCLERLRFALDPEENAFYVGLPTAT